MGSGMKPGDSFYRDGSLWLVQCSEELQNQTFRWLKVIARWSGWGPMPPWAREEHTFYTAHERKQEAT